MNKKMLIGGLLVVAGTLSLMSPKAEAGSVNISIGIGVASPAVVYAPPMMVPARVVVMPPPPVVYYRPAYAYYCPPAPATLVAARPQPYYARPYSGSGYLAHYRR